MKKLLSIVCSYSLLYCSTLEKLDENELSYNTQLSLQEPILMNPPQPLQDTALPAEMIPPPPQLIQRYKISAISVGLSTLVPGLGHYYLEDSKTASTILGTAATGIGLAVAGHNSASVLLNSAMAVQNTWFYGIYAAYRDTELYNGSSRKIPTDSFSDLAFAPFRYSVWKKPEVWGGILGAFGAATLITMLHNSLKHTPKASTGTVYPLLAFPVGLGEEAFFRGYVQSSLLEKMNPTAAISLSSIAFAAAHLGNGFALEGQDRRNYFTTTIPFITAMGAYLGWLTFKNNSLQESVAVHAWYDFILFGVAALTKHATSSGQPTSFALSLPF